MTPNRFARHRRKTIVALCLFFLALFDVAGATVLDLTREAAERRRMQIEATLAEQKPRPAAKPEDKGDEALFRRKTPLYHHGLIPNASVEHAVWPPGHYYPVRTNSLGLRDARVREVPLALHPRLVVIGDSFTEGVGVPWEDTFAARLQSELGKEGIDVLDAGVASHCPSMYLRHMRDLVETQKLELDTLAVFVDMSDIHDEGVWYENEYWKDEPPEPSPSPGAPAAASLAPAPRAIERASHEDEEPPGPPLPAIERAKRFVWRHSLAARGVIALKIWLLAIPPTAPPPPIVRRRVGHTHSPRSRWAVDPALFQQYGKKGLRRCGQALDELVALCRAHGIKVILVVYPWPDEIDAHDVDSVHVRFFRAWAEKAGVPFFDLFPLFVNDENKFDLYDRYFFPDDCHWNAAGHRLVADEFLRRFRALGAR